MDAPAEFPLVRIRILRGTQGRLTGWRVHCQAHGFVDRPTPTKRASEAIAQDHAKTQHPDAANIETPVP